MSSLEDRVQVLITTCSVLFFISFMLEIELRTLWILMGIVLNHMLV